MPVPLSHVYAPSANKRFPVRVSPRFGAGAPPTDPPHQDTFIRAYETGKASFIALPPPQVLALPDAAIFALLEQRLGHDTLARALDPAQTIASPLAQAGVTDPSWLGKSHVVGVHPRVLGSFWNIVKYALTLSAAQNALHLLPVFEQQMNGLYLPNSWRISPEFFDPALAARQPQLDTPDKQLRACVNLLHAMGKAVGLDILRHTGNYSETMMAHPDYFMWVRLSPDGTAIADQGNTVHEQAQAVIRQFVAEWGDASAMAPDNAQALETRMAREGHWTVPSDTLRGPPVPPAFDLFDPALAHDDEARLSILLGPVGCPQMRLARRLALLHRLKDAGLFPAPVVDGPPFRPLTLARLDTHGWPVWTVGTLTSTNRGGLSHIFGAISPYKLYETDAQGRFQIDKPLPAVWQYLNRQVVALQKATGVDFMRGDMAHLDYRADAASPDTTPEALSPARYDMFSALKHAVQQENQVPWFAFLPETFLLDKPGGTHPDQHARWQQADLALGGMQGRDVSSAEWPARLRQRIGALAGESLPIASTMMTADSDSAHRPHRYDNPLANSVRAFAGLFSPPSYMGMGFEMKGPADAPTPQPPEAFTHAFNDGLKGHCYAWGRNTQTFQTITRLKQRLERDQNALLKAFQSGTTTLLEPNASQKPVLSWTLKPDGQRPEFLFVLNTDSHHPQRHVAIDTGDTLDAMPAAAPIVFDFSTRPACTAQEARITRRGKTLRVSRLAPGEGRIYRIAPKADA